MYYFFRAANVVEVVDWVSNITIIEIVDDIGYPGSLLASTGNSLIQIPLTGGHAVLLDETIEGPCKYILSRLLYKSSLE